MACSKCPAVETFGRTGKCRQCYAKYMREYRAEAKKTENERAWVRGAEAMRRAIVDELDRCGLEQFNGRTAAVFAQRVSVACAS